MPADPVQRWSTGHLSPGKEVRFDWSSSAQEPMQKVSWAAFSSDVELEVLPVTDERRLTLTYNLYCVDNLQDVIPTPNITNSPFYHELHAAVSSPHFLRDGGVLGFSCQHQYVFRDLNCTKHLPSLLKGADSIVYMAGISLGLPVFVKPFTSDVEVYFKGEKYWDSEYCHYVLPKFSMFIDGGSQKIVYQAAAILQLVCVPKWGKQRTSVGEPQQCSCGFQIEWAGHESSAGPGLYLVIHSIYPRPLNETGFYSEMASIRINMVFTFNSCHMFSMGLRSGLS